MPNFNKYYFKVSNSIADRSYNKTIILTLYKKKKIKLITVRSIVDYKEDFKYKLISSDIF